eukprot:s1421_g14.t1
MSEKQTKVLDLRFPIQRFFAPLGSSSFLDSATHDFDLTNEVVDRIWHEGFVDAFEAWEEVKSLAHWLHAATGQILQGLRLRVTPSCDRFSVTRKGGNRLGSRDNVEMHMATMATVRSKCIERAASASWKH